MEDKLILDEEEVVSEVHVERTDGKPAKAAETPKSPKTTISLDTETENVIRWDKEGRKLFFESDVGKFKLLADGDVRKLSVANRDAYLLALLANRRAIEAQPSAGLQIQVEYVRPSERLGFEYTEEFRAKFHPCLKRPDELSKAYQDGYTHVTVRDGVSGFGVSDEKGNIFVGVAGKVEQYLLKIPREVADERLEAIEERSRGFIGAVDSQAKEELAKAGGKPFTPNERDDKRWKEVSAPVESKSGG